MTILKRISNSIWGVVAGAALWVVARYEGGQRWGTGRSQIPAQVQDVRFDADSATREELVRKSRYFERNSPIVNRLVDLFEQFTVGWGGLQLVPASSDEVWNGVGKAWWNKWETMCDLTSLQTFGTLQSLIARTWFIDGEIFILKTRGAPRVDASGKPVEPSRPRIQLIEGHRVATPTHLSAGEGRTIIDGIQLDSRGRPTIYWVRTGLESDAYEPIPADRIIHVFEPSRAGQYRGLPFLYPCINTLHDLDDLQMLEIKSAKEAAEVANVLTNVPGEFNPNDIRTLRFSEAATKSDGTDVLEQRAKYLQSKLGGRNVVLKTGETFEQFRIERPSDATRALWDYLTSFVCAGVGISKLLVFPWSLQGTVTRADLDVANVFFRSRSSVLAAVFKEIYFWVMDWARYNDTTLADAPADWNEVVVIPPRAVNVDTGYNSAATLAELAAGTTTFREIFGMFGKDWRTELRQGALEAAYLHKLAKEFSTDGVTITPQEISNKALAALEQPQMQQPQPQAVAA